MENKKTDINAVLILIQIVYISNSFVSICKYPFFLFIYFIFTLCFRK